MEFASVFHRTVVNYCYMLDENQLIINLKTGYDVKEVNIVYGDRLQTESWAAARNGLVRKRMFHSKSA